MRRAVLVVITAAACHHGATPAAPTTGAITGLAWDRDTGYALEGAKIAAERDLEPGATTTPATPALATSAPGGIYDLAGLAPGRYTLHGSYHDQKVDAPGVVVVAGETTLSKLPFTPAHPEQVIPPVDDSSIAAITRSRPPDLAATAARIEGFVIDASTHAAVPGAVITAVGPAGPNAAYQTVSDDRGAFRLDSVLAGTYVISAYYSVGKRGQVEVRRSDIAIAAGEAAVVPLIVDMKQ